MRPKTITRQLAAADADGIAQAQARASAGDLTLNGALVAGGVAELGAQRHVIITSAGDDTGITFTVYGTDDFGRSISEVITGANAGAAESILNFRTVTRIAASGAAAGNVSAGTNAEGESTPYLLDDHSRAAPFDVGLSVHFGTGTATATVQYSFHQFHGDQDAKDDTTIEWHDHTVLTGLSAYASGSLESPVSAVRLRTTAGTDPVKLIVRQPAAV